MALIFVAVSMVWAIAGTSVSGVIQDPSGAAIGGASLVLVDSALKSESKTTSDSQGFYSFPALPAGHYDLTIEASGFLKELKTDLSVDAGAPLRLDTVMQLARQNETITVTESRKIPGRAWRP